jgi:phosphoribosyl-ATP pyrophosphohydrolase
VSRKDVLARLERAIAARAAADPSKSYVAQLRAKGDDAVLKKVGEEAAELLIAAKGGERAAIVHEVADLWFHCLVLLSQRGVTLAEVLSELERREGQSGIEEKRSRTAKGKDRR